MSSYKKVQNILYIGLSHGWGSMERGILRDGVILKNEGRKPLLYCYENSLIACEAAKKGITVIHPGKVITSLFQWRIFLGLPRIVREFDIGLVHFYQMEFVWPLCIFLYRFIEVPLVMTVRSEIKGFYNNILYRTLIYRVDMFLCPFEGFKKNVASHLMVKPKKVSCLGMAPLFTDVQEREVTALGKGDSGLRMGILCNGEKGEELHLRIVFHALTVFNETLGQRVFLELISEGCWEDNPSYRHCRELSWEYQMGDWISFQENNALLDYRANFDLWIGLPRREDFEDISLWALLCGTPVLIPRTGASMEFFESCDGSGECYKSGDGREFWQKGLQMLQEIDSYKKGLKKHLKKIGKSCDVSLYGKSLLVLYDGLRVCR